MTKFLKLTAGVSVFAMLAACAGGEGTSMSGSAMDPSTNNRLQLNEGMSVAQAQAIVGDFQTRDNQGNGVVCYGIVFDELSSSGPKALNVSFRNGQMFAQDIESTPCGSAI